jgi:hypothetical protein
MVYTIRLYYNVDESDNFWHVKITFNDDYLEFMNQHPQFILLYERTVSSSINDRCIFYGILDKILYRYSHVDYGISNAGDDDLLQISTTLATDIYSQYPMFVYGIPFNNSNWYDIPICKTVEKVINKCEISS